MNSEFDRLKAVFVDTGPQLFRLIARITECEHSAEEQLQQLMLKNVEQPSRLREIQNLGAYLRRSAIEQLSTGEDMYRLDDGLAYSFGGAFVDFLLRRYSAGQFVEIYNAWKVETSDEDFRTVFGKTPSELEDEFWLDAKAIAEDFR